jgi:hypothetical protein
MAVARPSMAAASAPPATRVGIFMDVALIVVTVATAHDTRLMPGGCQVPSPAGRIDGGVTFGQ